MTLGMPRPQRRAARSSRTLWTTVAVASVGTALLWSLGVAFGLPYGGKGMPAARSGLKPTEELPREEEPEPEEKIEELPKRRASYVLNMYAPAPHDGQRGLSPQSREYIIDKVEGALHNTQDWVQSVDVRVTIDSHNHKIAKTKLVDEDDVDFEGDEGVRTKAVKQVKRELAPFMIECTVHLKGKEVVLSASPKHAQATLTEAVDHMYDVLKRQMSKVKEKRIKQARAAKREGAALDPTEAQAVLETVNDEVDEELKLREKAVDSDLYEWGALEATQEELDEEKAERARMLGELPKN